MNKFYLFSDRVYLHPCKKGFLAQKNLARIVNGSDRATAKLDSLGYMKLVEWSLDGH